MGKKVLLAFAVLLTGIAIAAGYGAVWVLDTANSAPSIDSLKPLNSGANSEVFAADGSSLGYVQTDINREPVKLSEIPKRLQHASIAIEDENFYEHSGVDYSAVARAAIENIEAGEVKQGGSTITQQLVRNLYIDDPEDTIERKIIEAEMAREYEDEHSKDEILNRYLNTATYGTNDGRTAAGVEAASQVYFDKHVSDLNLTEAALLAGLPQAPTDYNPFLNPDGAKNRRNQVLKAMHEQGYISASKYDKARHDGLGLHRGYHYETRQQQYFFDFVQQELISKYGVKTVRDGGLKVYTTLDPKLQAVAEQAIANHPITGAASALVSTKTGTGEIIAMASSESYEDDQFNLAAQGRRQPGSSFKPFVLTTAVDQGIDPDATYYPAPSSITLYPPGAEPWPVSGGGSGSMSLRDATVHSVNVVYAQLGLDVGPENFTDMAHRMGITSPLLGVPAEAIGGTYQCCSPLEMSNAFATLADGGVHHKPTAIERVEFPDGKVDEPDDPAGDRVISDGVAYTVADIMTGVLDSGTAACCDIPCPAAGKTGTTDTQADAWFVGYTPHVSTAVWTGNPDARIPLPGYGADLSAPIWQEYMSVAAASPCDDFPAPEDPADLSPYYSDQTTSSSSDSDSDYDSTYGTTTPTTPVTPTTPTTPDGTGDTGGYDPDLYAPGAGQDPAPTPREATGGTGN
ncbi:MAG: glycosyl transferase [Solirubrobacterales bacterium]|nr:glycosyl transferase [Solirubrobacterales bacterium]